MKNGLRLASLAGSPGHRGRGMLERRRNAGPRPANRPPARHPAAAPPRRLSAAALPDGDFALTLWTKEGEADGSFQYVKSLTDAYTAAHPNVTFEVVNKDVEALREDFQTSSLAGDPPDLLWTGRDHCRPVHTRPT